MFGLTSIFTIDTCVVLACRSNLKKLMLLLSICSHAVGCVEFNILNESGPRNESAITVTRDINPTKERKKILSGILIRFKIINSENLSCLYFTFRSIFEACYICISLLD